MFIVVVFAYENERKEKQERERERRKIFYLQLYCSRTNTRLDITLYPFDTLHDRQIYTKTMSGDCMLVQFTK